LDASRHYDPSASRGAFQAPVAWVNSGDDFINPLELCVAQGMAERIKRGCSVLIPASAMTHGHGAYARAALWTLQRDLLAESR
jgi:homoserine O-acetyltransferase